jgi:NDP-sugar pyrophosphorylase family protein
MKAVLICPGERLDVPLLAREAPLALTVALGQCVVEYWMSQMACAGARQVVLLANDRVEEVRQVVGTGSRWGVAATVIPESVELTPEHAAEKYGAPAMVMDHFPGLPDHPLFTGYARWFNALEAWMPRAKTPDRVGVRESAAGVWVGLHGHISQEARLCAPCWVGDHVYVGPGAVIGPGAVLENGAFIEPEAEITNTVIGPGTFVGRYMRMTNSLVRGNNVINWQTGLETNVPESFLLCSLHPRQSGAVAVPLLDRFAKWLTVWTAEEPMEPQPLLIKPET